MTNHADNRSTWQHLPADEKRLLFERLHTRIESRASEMIELRRFFVKTLVASNATAAAATLAFVGSIAKDGLSQAAVTTCGIATLIFVIGFAMAIIFLLIAIARSRETAVAESEYLNEIVNRGRTIEWHDNYRIQRLSPLKFSAGFLFAIISAVCLVTGTVMVLKVLIAT